ncbi:activator-dependent family glycosyltransferase [Micromonospora sp. NPDC006431]|uniref:activator-dependent family glycosyltransferase n=1 Tax=Micromonospora sp. NPDC006431 TaxID=3364235 RepID=UPI0036AC41DE
MRILFLTCASRTHLYAMAPLAWALQTAGHHVRVASQPDPSGLTVEDVAHTGLTAVSIGDEIDVSAMMADAVAATTPQAAIDSPYEQQRKSVQDDYVAADPHHELDLLARYHFTGFNPDSVIDGAVRFARTWKPDLVIWDGMTMAFSGPVAAQASGAAHARLLISTDALVQLRTAAREKNPDRDPIRDSLQPILDRFSLDFDEEMVLGQWTINAMPPWTWQPPGMDYLMMRPIPFNGPSVVPEWLQEEPERRRVCLTLGLSFRELSAGASITELIEAVAGLDVEVVLTLSKEQLASLPSVPENVRPVHFVPMTALLPTCSAIVHHGGLGTFTTALEHGVPQLLVPGKFGNDKFWGPVAVANGLEEQGAGAYVSDPGRLTAAGLRGHLLRVLNDPAFARNAARLSAEAAELPTPNDIVPDLEKLTLERRGHRP